jgi:hypothetical protein
MLPEMKQEPLLGQNYHQKIENLARLANESSGDDLS